MRILFDTNVLLDVLLRREPFRHTSTQLVNAVEAHHLTGLLCATSVTTAYYFSDRAFGADRALQDMHDILILFEVAPVGRTVLDDAVKLGFNDFEDAVIHEAARHAAAEGIVTRNEIDFSQAQLPVYSPDDLLQFMRRQ